MKTPTVISYSLKIEQEITPNTSLSVGYVGSHGYSRAPQHRHEYSLPR